MAKFLLKRYNVKLLLIGRTELPSRNTWDELSEQEAGLAVKIKNYRDIEKVSTDFIYTAADIADTEAVQKAIETAEKNCGGTLAGVFHLAGEGNLEHHWKVAQQRMILQETGETIELMLQPKVQGTMSLLEVVKNRPGVFFAGFSSVMSIFGGSTFSAYSAANSCLESLLTSYRNSHKQDTFCFSWSLWDDIGMSKNNMESSQTASRSMGYMTIDQRQGLFSILAGIQNHAQSVYIGLDRSKPHIRKTLKDNDVTLQKLVGYYTGSGADVRTELVDVFGNKVDYLVHKIDAMPKDANGVIDRNALRLLKEENSGGEREEHVAPRNEVEEKLVGIFKEVLNLTQKISIKDNFFDLGANSILLVKAHSMIQAQGYDVQIVDLFNYTTIERLAGFMADKKAEAGPESRGQEAAAIAEDRKAMMQRRRQRRK